VATISFFGGLNPRRILKWWSTGKRVIMIGSNNCLGLTNHPRVKEAAIKAIEKFGTGCAGSRFLNGNLEIHEELEKKLARFFLKEVALVFAAG
jgi:8-amino-7-oxononanoate synthase